jgi:hypothetical protein
MITGYTFDRAMPKAQNDAKIYDFLAKGSYIINGFATQPNRSNPLNVSLGSGKALVKGRYISYDSSSSPLSWTFTANSSGVLVIRIDISQTNTATGYVGDDATFSMINNQLSIQNLAAVNPDIDTILYTWTSSATEVTFTQGDIFNDYYTLDKIKIQTKKPTDGNLTIDENGIECDYMKIISNYLVGNGFSFTQKTMPGTGEQKFVLTVQKSSTLSQSKSVANLTYNGATNLSNTGTTGTSLQSHFLQYGILQLSKNPAPCVVMAQLSFRQIVSALNNTTNLFNNNNWFSLNYNLDPNSASGDFRLINDCEIIPLMLTIFYMPNYQFVNVQTKGILTISLTGYNMNLKVFLPKSITQNSSIFGHCYQINVTGFKNIMMMI